MQEERDASSDKVTGLDANITELQCMLNRANAAARAANKENAAAVSGLDAQVQRLNEGRPAFGRRRRSACRRRRRAACCRSRSTSRPRKCLAAARRSPRSGRSWQTCAAAATLRDYKNTDSSATFSAISSTPSAPSSAVVPPCCSWTALQLLNKLTTLAHKKN
eukprot:4006022-Pleurochrysis_carterae.AAC.1